MTAPESDDDDVDVVTVPGIGIVAIRRRLPREQARALVKVGMLSETSSEAFRDRLLEATAEAAQVARLSEASRHRLALAVLRTWGLWPQWRRLYGSRITLADRMRDVLLRALREQTRSQSLADVQGGLPALTAVRVLPALQAVQSVQTRFVEPMRAVQRTIQTLTAPLMSAMQRIREWLDSIMRPVRAHVDAFARAPLVREASAVLNRRLDVGRTSGPVAALLRLHRDQQVAALAELARQAATLPPQPSTTTELVLPDDGALVTFFVEERGDPSWRKGPLGWLLRVVPLPLGASVHELLQESREAALAWLAERLLRRELRRLVETGLSAVPCEQATRDVLLAGVEHYLRREWAPADTLLTAGLDGLLLRLAVGQGVITEGRRLRTGNGKPGRQFSTAGDTKLLTEMGFDASQIAYLTGLSLGPTGNPPRHGAASPIGSDIHAAGSLLGLLLVLAWASQEKPLVARALALAA